MRFGEQPAIHIKREQERPEWKQNLNALILLPPEEGLRNGKADRSEKDGVITAREWFDYATDRVPQMQEAEQGGRLLLQDTDTLKDPARVRNFQHPRAFYRREPEWIPLITFKSHDNAQREGDRRLGR